MNILTMIPWSLLFLLFCLGIPVFLIVAFIIKGKKKKANIKSKLPILFYILSAASLGLAILSLFLDHAATLARRKEYMDNMLFNNGGYSLSEYISDIESKADQALDDYKENAESTISDIKDNYNLQ